MSYLLYQNILCSDVNTMNYSVGIFTNTLPDPQLATSVQYISDIIKNTYNISKYSLIVKLLTLPDTCEDITNVFNVGYNSSDGDKIRLFIGFWTNTSVLECINKAADIGYNIVNLAISCEICSNSIYHAYHLQELIYASIYIKYNFIFTFLGYFVISRNVDPIHVVYYTPINNEAFIKTHKNIFQSDPLGAYYYEIENNTQFTQLSKLSEEKGNIVYFLDSYHSGLNEFIDSIKSFYNSDEYTLIFIGYVNQNLFTPEQIQFLQNAYFISYYFHSIDNKENNNFIKQMNLLQKQDKYMYDTLSFLYHTIFMWYMNEFNEVQLQYPSYSWINRINIIYRSVYGLTYLDISNYYQHPCFIGQLRNNDIVIVFVKSYTSTTSPFHPLRNESTFTLCNIIDTPSRYKIPIKYILLVTRKKYFRHFYVSALLSLYAETSYSASQVSLLALISFYENVSDIPNIYFKSNTTITILSFAISDKKNDLIIRNTERIQLYDLAFHEGGLCSRDYITV